MMAERNILEDWVWRTLEESGTAFTGEEMKLKVDKENDALYLRLDDSIIVESEEVQPGVILDFDENNRVVGIEILDLSTRVKPDMLKLVQLETV
jgi:uncharacterized protein YuzE